MTGHCLKQLLVARYKSRIGKYLPVIVGERGWSMSRAQFLQQVSQRYAYHAARAKLEEQGFTLASEEVREDGRIHLVLRRMA